MNVKKILQPGILYSFNSHQITLREKKMILHVICTHKFPLPTVEIIFRLAIKFQ